MSEARSAGGARRRGWIEVIADALGVGVGRLATFVATSGVAFAIFGVLWIAFGAALLTSPAGLHDAWQWLASLPLLVQLVAWLLLLPVTAGLWVWETDWPLIVRLLLVGGLAGWSLWMFFPRALLRRGRAR